MTDVGKIDCFLGIHVERNSNDRSITLCQSRYLKNVFKKFGMNECKSAATPIEYGSSLLNGDKNSQPYGELIGCLTYVTLTTRPDLCASTNHFSRFRICYTDEHFKYAKRVLR